MLMPNASSAGLTHRVGPSVPISLRKRNQRPNVTSPAPSLSKETNVRVAQIQEAFLKHRFQVLHILICNHIIQTFATAAYFVGLLAIAILQIPSGVILYAVSIKMTGAPGKTRPQSVVTLCMFQYESSLPYVRKR